MLIEISKDDFYRPIMEYHLNVHLYTTFKRIDNGAIHCILTTNFKFPENQVLFGKVDSMSPINGLSYEKFYIEERFLNVENLKSYIPKDIWEKINKGGRYDKG